MSSLAPLFMTAFAACNIAAQCIVDNPGGSKANIYRPSDSDVPAASFSPLSHINGSLPAWICFTAGYRARYEGSSAGNFAPGNSDSYLLGASGSGSR